MIRPRGNQLYVILYGKSHFQHLLTTDINLHNHHVACIPAERPTQAALVGGRGPLKQPHEKIPPFEVGPFLCTTQPNYKPMTCIQGC